MQFDRALAVMKVSPRENRQAQINHRRIQRTQRILESKVMAGRQSLATLQ
jgi:hypothetical protein